MLIYDLFEQWAWICRRNQMDDIKNLVMGIVVGVVIWAVLFVLQGIGIYTMAKNRKMQKKWLAFVPIVNMFYIGKLVGEYSIFGRKVKRLGLYASLAQAVYSLVCVGLIAAELYLYVEGGRPTLVEGTYLPMWTELTGTPYTIFKLYDIGVLLLPIFGLVCKIVLFLLYTGLYKKYYPQNYFLLSYLALFITVSPYIVVFVIRKRKAIDFEQYMREKREAFFRQQQQYRNMYNNPQNPYGTYTWGPQQTGNPYAQRPEPKKEEPEEPFSEFSSDKKTEEPKNEEKTENKSDDFFS